MALAHHRVRAAFWDELLDEVRAAIGVVHDAVRASFLPPPPASRPR